ncbi:MAG: Rieske 2Fe-2S domain-containing protein [Planctomycetota bacterium]|nr:Rieske 2Fe-2S domain-containing protein [Planctomycetota bacterium]
MPETWIPAFDAAELVPGAAKLVRSDDKQIAVFRTENGEIYAVDNRCPHEGYPLLSGQVKGCVLTCAWHNFKFDLRDGSCVLGDDDVRTFPVRVIGHRVEVDVQDPDPSEQLPRLWTSLEEALLERRLGKVARDITRLLQLGTSVEQLALFVVRFDAERGEFGSTHVLPVAMDVLDYAPRFQGMDIVLPLMQPFELAAETHVRRAKRAVAEPVHPGEDPLLARQRFHEFVEAEETEAAESLLRGALQAGWQRDVIEPWFLELCADHFLDFGHALIYSIKVFDFLDIVGFEHADDILSALLYMIGVGTREDTLPPWTPFRARLHEIEPGFEEMLSFQDGDGPEGWSRDAFVAAVTDGKDAEAFEAIAASLRLGVPISQMIEGLVLAASERLLRFDVAHDANPGVQDGWLFATHILTYANAVRAAMQRHRGPRSLRHLFFLARFINKAKTLDNAPETRGILVKIRLRETRTDALAQIVDHIRRKQTGEAVSLVLKYLSRRRDLDRLRSALLDLALADSSAVRPIIVAHMIKTTIAAFDECNHFDERDKMRSHPVLALTRFLASPVVERFTARQSHEAVNFVVHGKVPKVLS